MLGDAVCHEANNYTSVNEGGHHRSFEADLELVLDGGADADGSGTLARVHLLKQPGFVLFKDVLFAVAGHVDELRVEPHEALDGAKKRINGIAFERRQHFKGDQRLVLSLLKIFRDFHIIFWVRGQKYG